MRREGADQIDVKKGGGVRHLFTGWEYNADHPPQGRAYPGRMLPLRFGSDDVAAANAWRTRRVVLQSGCKCL